MKKKTKIEEKNVSPEVNEVEELKTKVESLEAKVAELEDIKLRQMAEFDNYRRRTQKEKLELMDNAGEGIFRDMLPLADDWERMMGAMDKYDDVASLKEGAQLVYDKFVKFLNDHKVTAIETENKDFSTDEHEAITTFAAGEDKKGKVIDCTQKGYKLGEKVIRFAKVVVGE
ncbi:MAG: nucleotide exchange factor GrpE [Paludibacteraceae bacterium]|nr:nucleotide exchange factor GrpE [Paludibacteraceae bacterium]